MNIETVTQIISDGDKMWHEGEFVDAYSSYESTFPILIAQSQKDKRSRAIGSAAGWTTAFITGLGIEDLFLIPAVSKGVSSLLGVNDADWLYALATVCARQIDCLLRSEDLYRTVDKNLVFIKFAILLKDTREMGMTERILNLYIPEYSIISPFDDPEIINAAYSLLLNESQNNSIEKHDVLFLLHRYLQLVNDQSELRKVLSHIFNAEDFHHEDHREYSSKKSSPKNSEYYYQVLGLNADASKEDVRNAYMTLIKKYHPDRFASLSQDFQDLANRRTQEITEAYNFLMGNS